MRTLTLPLKDNLVLKKKAVEPLIVLGIEWSPGHETLYSDRKINGTNQAYPIMVNTGRFNTSQIVTGSSSSENIPIVLSDVEEGTYTGHLKSIIDNTDIHKAKARLYMMVQGVNLIDRTLLTQGQINSPLEFDEGDRTLSFTIYNQLESVEAGFAMEDGDFPAVPEDLRGLPWPMVFGEVCWEKTQRVRAPRKGYLVEAQGVADPTLNDRICQARNIMCGQKYSPPRTGIITEDDNCISWRDNRTGRSGCSCAEGDCQLFQAIDNAAIDDECLQRRQNELCRLLRRKEDEDAKVKNPMTLRDVDDFPQNELIRINIEGVIFEGVLSGTSFTWSSVIHPQFEDINNPPCKKITEAVYGYRVNASRLHWGRTDGNERTFERDGPNETISNTCDPGGDPITKVINGAGESWRYYESFKGADFILLNPGAEVFLEDETDIIHIANLFGGTVTGVAAYRQFEGNTILVNLPTDYYEIRTTDYGDYDSVLEVVLTKPLKQYKDEDWEEDIYVRVVSDVGPNPADCIKFLVEKYLSTSGITMDSASYTSVKSKLTNYPIGTMVTARPSVFSLIDDIARQSRCAAIIRDGKLVLIYLSEQPTPIRTLTMADIVPESVRITHGDTDDLNTKHNITWSRQGGNLNKNDDPEMNFSIKFNIPLYGTSEVDYNYYTQNTFSTIMKSATFWMIRESTTWKRVHFETPMTQIDLDVFDAVALNIPHFTANTTVIIEEADYDVDRNTIRFKAWTPVRAGETSTYIWAWPAQQDSQEKFPLQGTDDGRSGDAVGLTVAPPVGHALRAGFRSDFSDVQSAGDNSPSDLDDVLPTLNCPDAHDVDVTEPLTPFTFNDFSEIAKRQDDAFENNQDSFAGGGSSDDDQEQTVCGSPHPSDTCTYTVNVTMITPDSVTTTFTSSESACKDGGPCDCGGLGRPCTGLQGTMCHTFGARWAADQFRTSKLAEFNNLWENCLYECGVPAVISVGPVKAIPGSGGFGECEDAPGDPTNPAVGEGEITAPSDV